MIALLEKDCGLRRKAEILRWIESRGFRAHVTELPDAALVGVLGAGAEELAAALLALPGVREVRPESPPWPLVSREHHPEPTRVRVGEVTVGGREVIVAAGPCAVESEGQLLASARAAAGAGARLLRGGAFKPRSSPYGFQGLGEEALRLLQIARAETGLPVVSEVLSEEDLDLVASHVDLLQIGARNMQNFRLLAAVGRKRTPVLLKRGLSATLDELLLAAEYVVSAGNPQVILCERGIRTFERATRATLDLSAVPVLRGRTHLPIFVDPSHAAGLRELVPALAVAAVAAGADGLLVEIHPQPEQSLSDGRQSLDLPAFARMMEGVRAVATAVGREVAAG